MRKTIRRRERWKKPPEGKLLMNIDGSFRLSERDKVMEEQESSSETPMVRLLQIMLLFGTCGGCLNIGENGSQRGTPASSTNWLQ